MYPTLTLKKKTPADAISASIEVLPLA